MSAAPLRPTANYRLLQCVTLAMVISIGGLSDAHAFYFKQSAQHNATQNKTGQPTSTQAPGYPMECAVDGVEDAIEEDILQYCQSQAATKAPFTSASITALLPTLANDIKTQLQAHGYFEAQVNVSLHTKKTKLKRTKTWYVKISTHPGPPVRIHTVDVRISGEGAQHQTIQRKAREFPIQKGDVVNSKIYEQAKQHLFDVAFESGYLNAAAKTAIVEIDVAHQRADIKIHIDTGRRFYFADVTFEQDGVTPLSATVLRRLVPFHRGDAYSPLALQKLQQNLNAANEFEHVTVTADRDNARNHQVPVNVQLRLRKRNRYEFGIGYGTDTDVRGSTTWSRRRLNPHGHRSSATLKASSVQQTLQGKYTIPGKHNPATDSYNIIAGYQHSDVKTGERQTLYASVDYSKDFKSVWQRIIALNFVSEEFQAIKKNIKQPKTTGELLMPSLTYVMLKKDDPLKPTRGQRLRLDIRGAHEALASSTSFFQVHAQAKALYMPADWLRWLVRAELGYTAAETFRALPLSQRFHAGGTQSVRGYDFEALGPGRNVVTLSFEQQHRVRENWFIGGFFDMGNAGGDFLPEMKKAAGVSLSWLSPIGTIALSVAKPLDRLTANDNKNWLFQFSIGPEL